MAWFEHGDTRIHYEDQGSGFPVLLLAPGGMRSAAALWERAPFDPRTVLAPSFRVISMDQRNAGSSRGPITGDDGWHTYTNDQIALLDHLGIERCHVLGMCIGGPFCLGLMAAAPQRIAAGVLLQPIGHDGNRQLFRELFDAWAAEQQAAQAHMTAADWEAFRERMFGGEFVFHPDRATVSTLPQPALILRGDDPYHPAAVSDELASVLPEAELIREWKEGAAMEQARQRVVDWLQARS